MDNTVTEQPELNPKVLIADDDEDIRLALELLLLSKGYQVVHASCPNDVLTSIDSEQPNLILLDMNFSLDTTSGKEGLALLPQIKPYAVPVILMTAWGTIELALEGLKQGASDFFEKPWNKEKLLNSIEQQLSHAQLKQENEGYKRFLSTNQLSPKSTVEWVCESAAMKKIEAIVSQVSPTDANILILGENGTGKSMLAERIHSQSMRSEYPLISVNMAAIPDNLFESELFGHQKGAFTDAKQARVGRFQLANKGTLFFDEIGALPTQLQPKLLRVLESGQFEVLGSSKTHMANVRLISATNSNLRTAVNDSVFRQDLLYRLNTIEITMPPLRERLDDLHSLAQLFIRRHCKKYNRALFSISNSAIDKLKYHSWPGNVRELSHVIERAVLLSSGNVIETNMLMIDNTISATNDGPLQSLEAAEKQLIERALQSSNGNIIDAAKILDISRNSLYRRIEKHQLTPPTSAS